MPGLANMHVHLNFRGAARGAQDDWAAFFLALRRSIRDGSVGGLQIYTTGAPTDGSPPIRPCGANTESSSVCVPSNNFAQPSWRARTKFDCVPGFAVHEGLQNPVEGGLSRNSCSSVYVGFGRPSGKPDGTRPGRLRSLLLSPASRPID